MAIWFRDDKKEKYQSHEATFTAHISGEMNYTDIEITGYGASKDESLKNLKIAMDEVFAQIAEGSNVELRGDASRRPS